MQGGCGGCARAAVAAGLSGQGTLCRLCGKPTSLRLAVKLLSRHASFFSLSLSAGQVIQADQVRVSSAPGCLAGGLPCVWEGGCGLHAGAGLQALHQAYGTPNASPARLLAGSCRVVIA